MHHEDGIHVVTVIGARPQFVKAAAFSRAVAAYNAAGPAVPLRERIVHTGQHYDPAMSQAFFDELRIPAPAINLQVGSGTHARQTADILSRLEPFLLESRPDWVLVYGDTNSTLAGALAAAKMGIPIAHVEAGLRSHDRAMPEEINRIVADRLASLLLCPSRAAAQTLAREAITEGVHVVGDLMYDSVLFHASGAMPLPVRGEGHVPEPHAHPRQTAYGHGTHKIPDDVLARLSFTPKSYLLATVHRAENTDDPLRLAAILESLEALDYPVILPLHPRTRAILARAGRKLGGAIRAIEPVPYLDMLRLEGGALAVLTDSGGVQKEAFWLGVPCVILRDRTEWVELVQEGCAVLAGADGPRLAAAVRDFASKSFQLPPHRADLYGDGQCARRIVEHLVSRFSGGLPRRAFG